MEPSVTRLFAPFIKRGFVYAGGVKLFRLISNRGTVQLIDDDTRRVRRRGSRVVEVGVRELCDLLQEEVGQPEIFYDSEKEGAL